MVKEFPLKYTLESGTKVVVNKTGGDTYDFSLTHHEKPVTQFVYVNDGRPKAEWDEKLSFEQLEALRHFWLVTEGIV